MCRLVFRFDFLSLMLLQKTRSLLWARVRSVEAHVANGTSLEIFANVTNVSSAASVAYVANVACSCLLLLHVAHLVSKHPSKPS